MPASVATKASNSSASAAVENAGDVMFEVEFDRLVETVTSVATADHAGAVMASDANRPSSHPMIEEPVLRRLRGAVAIGTSRAGAAITHQRTIRVAGLKASVQTILLA
jgi:hypothetical protein